MDCCFIPIDYIKKKVPNFNIQQNDIIVLETEFGIETFYVLNFIYINGKIYNTIICRYFQNNFSFRGRRNCIQPFDLGNLKDIGILLGIYKIKDNNAIIRLNNRNQIINLIKFYKTNNKFIKNIRLLPDELFFKISEFI